MASYSSPINNGARPSDEEAQPAYHTTEKMDSTAHVEDNTESKSDVLGSPVPLTREEQQKVMFVSSPEWW
jgi:hypothetical protein